MKRELEALLFATDGPLTLQRLRALFPEAGGKEIRDAIRELAEEYDQAGHAFAVVEFGGGWQIATRPEFSPVVERLMRGRRFARLSRAALEVLAVVAYRQPVTRVEIEDIRGVQCESPLSTLMERDLVTVVGRAETVGHPLLYGTTREFLNHLGLRGLNQLPDLPQIEKVVGSREELRRFAEQVGREVTDEDLERWEREEEAEGAAGGPDEAILSEPAPGALASLAGQDEAALAEAAPGTVQPDPGDAEPDSDLDFDPESDPGPDLDADPEPDEEDERPA